MSDQELAEDEEWVYEDDWSCLRTKEGLPYKHQAYFSDFIDNFMKDPGSPTQALRDAGFPESKSMTMTAKRMYETLKPYIFERFEEQKKKFALLGYQKIIDVAEDTDAPHREKLQAGKLLMDYGGHAPSVSIDVDMQVDITDVRQKALDRMKVIDGDIVEDNDMVSIDKETLSMLLEAKEKLDGKV